MPFYNTTLGAIKRQKPKHSSKKKNRPPLGLLLGTDLNSGTQTPDSESASARPVQLRACSLPQGRHMNDVLVTEKTEEVPGSLWSARETEILVEIIEKDLDITSCFGLINRTEDAIKRKWRKVGYFLQTDV